MTPQEALVIVKAKVTLPKGVSVVVNTSGTGVMVGFPDFGFVLAGPAIEHDEEYLLHCANNHVKSLEAGMAAYVEQKAAQAAAAALVVTQKQKRKK